MRKKISQIDAAMAGEIMYFTGVPCKRGHIDFRYTINSVCRKCNSERTKENRKKRKALILQSQKMKAEFNG